MLALESDPFIDTVFLNSLDHPSLDIRIHQGNFAWNSLAQVDSDDVALKEINLSIARGSLVLILGRVGSKTDALQSEHHSSLSPTGGKTTLLNALLGELNKINGSINVHRVIDNGFAYVR